MRLEISWPAQRAFQSLGKKKINSEKKKTAVGKKPREREQKISPV